MRIRLKGLLENPVMEYLESSHPMIDYLNLTCQDLSSHCRVRRMRMN